MDIGTNDGFPAAPPRGSPRVLTPKTRLTNSPSFDDHAAWSADGQKIAFVSNRDGNAEIYVMNATGAGQTRLTSNATYEDQPAWSPDGLKVAFRSTRDGNSEIYVMNADGSGQTRLTTNGAMDSDPEWSPYGQKIAFQSDRDGNSEIYVMNANGSGQSRTTINGAFDSSASWSPDGSKIAFYTDRHGPGTNDEVYTMNSDGTNQLNRSNAAGNDRHPAWSPDGTKLAFESSRDGNLEMYAMNSDGTGQTRLTNNGSDDSIPNWQPLPYYDVPSSASTIHYELVPNFRQTISTTQCSARGGLPSTHGLPDLPGGANPDQSCNPPGFVSGTVAHMGPQATSPSTITLLPGNPATLVDEADVSLVGTVTDVRNGSATGPDYLPSMSGVAKVRLTDRLNSTPPQSCNTSTSCPGTVIDLELASGIACTPTADPSIGSSCGTATTGDAGCGGCFVEGRGQIVQTFRIRWKDAGIDGNAGNLDDRDVFMQGIYVPYVQAV